RAPGEEDDVVVLGEALHDGEALGVGLVVDGGGEEALPVLGPALEVVEAVPGVGQDAVDVDDGEVSHRPSLPGRRPIRGRARRRAHPGGGAPVGGPRWCRSPGGAQPSVFLMADTSNSRVTFSPTSTPPVSSGAFQVRPKSLRLTTVEPSRPMRSLPNGSRAGPESSTSKEI